MGTICLRSGRNGQQAVVEVDRQLFQGSQEVVYDERERAGLARAETVTRVADAGSDEVFQVTRNAT